MHYWSQLDKQVIVDSHNRLRSLVARGLATGQGGKDLPQAADMNEVHWDQELANGAQLYIFSLPCRKRIPHDSS